jgi:hypothetical protein
MTHTHFLKDPKATKAKKHKKPKTLEEKAYLKAVKRLPCCTIGCGRTPCDAHHIKDMTGAGLKENDFMTIPLCKECHQEGKQSVHKAKKTWERINGTQREHVEKTQEKLKHLLTSV